MPLRFTLLQINPKVEDRAGLWAGVENKKHWEIDAGLHALSQWPLCCSQHGFGNVLLFARSGGQRLSPTRRARDDRGELRTHPPLESGRHGCSAAGILRRLKPEDAVIDWRESLSHRRDRVSPGRLHAGAGANRHPRRSGEAPRGRNTNHAARDQCYRHGGILQYVLRQLAQPRPRHTVLVVGTRRFGGSAGRVQPGSEGNSMTGTESSSCLGRRMSEG
jgi:hypothetical protein